MAYATVRHSTDSVVVYCMFTLEPLNRNVHEYHVTHTNSMHSERNYVNLKMVPDFPRLKDGFGSVYVVFNPLVLA